MVDESGADGSPELTALARALVRLELLPARFHERISLKDLEHEILLLLYKHERAGSARQTLSRVRSLASVVRDRFSSDTWSILNKLNIDARSRPRRIPLADALALLNTMIVDLSAFSGMEMENMTRGLGWRFLDFGRRLERAVQIVQLFRASFGRRKAGFDARTGSGDFRQFDDLSPAVFSAGCNFRRCWNCFCWMKAIRARSHSNLRRCKNMPRIFHGKPVLGMKTTSRSGSPPFSDLLRNADIVALSQTSSIRLERSA